MKIGRLLGLCLIVPMLMGMQTRCSMPPEFTSPLPVRGTVDERLAGYWYLVDEEGRVTDTLQIMRGRDATTINAIYSFMAIPKIYAEATASNVEGRPIYSVTRAIEPGGFNWTGVDQVPGYIFVEPRLDDADRLHLIFMNPEVVDELAKQGRVNARLVEVFRYDDTGERVAPSERNKERKGLNVNYFLLDLTEEELVQLLRTVPMHELFSADIGPFHRVDTRVEPGTNPFVTMTVHGEESP